MKEVRTDQLFAGCVSKKKRKYIENRRQKILTDIVERTPKSGSSKVSRISEEKVTEHIRDGRCDQKSNEEEATFAFHLRETEQVGLAKNKHRLSN